MFYLLFLTTLSLAAPLSPHQGYIRWVQQWDVVDHAEENYRFYAEMHHQIAEKVQERPGVVHPFRLGRTVEQRSIWGFRIRNPKTKPSAKILVFAGLHPLEWVGMEVALDVLLTLAEHPPENVEIVVVPVINVDRRLVVEFDVFNQRHKYRRVNSGGEDLNREFEIHRHEKNVWRHIFKARYEISSAPLSQPESQALDALAQEGFDAAVSLHCFGGYIYYPWAGVYKRPPDWRQLHEMALVMKKAQPGMRSYRAKQLSHWMFPFRPQATELDHLYGKYGINTFLIEMTRSGIVWYDRKTWKDPFRLYNPRDPKRDIERGKASVLALVQLYNFSF